MGGKPDSIDPVKLFCGIILSPGLEASRVIGRLEAVYGKADFISAPVSFSAHTDYYQVEMGENLQRIFISFEPLIDRQLLPDIKHQTRSIEAEFASEGKRMVNLDPGYMGLGQLFLVTTKDNFHRIYLRDGIYAEVTLYYKAGKWSSFPWTYRDYQSEPYHRAFDAIRTIYRRQLKQR